MPFNGSGTFSRVHNWQEDADNSIAIVPDRHDEEDDGYADGLSNCMTRDGQSPATANIPFGGHRATGLADGVSATDAATVEQLQSNGATFATSTGSANAYVLTPSPAISAYAAGQEFTFLANFLSTGACTIAISGLAAKNIKVEGLYDLPAYAIKSGQIVTIVYDGTSFQPKHMWSVTGDILHYSASSKAGYLRLEGTITVGDAASGAANANAAMEGMYRHIYDTYDDAEAPVSTGRGASAVADFAAHKTITLPNFKDRSIYGVGVTLTKAGKSSGAATVASTGIVGTSGATTLTANQIPTIAGKLVSSTGTGVNNADNATGASASGEKFSSTSNTANTILTTSTNTGGASHTHTGGTYTGDATSVLHPVIGLYPLMKI